MKSPAVKCLLLLRTHYSMCTSKHYIYSKANSSSFHFTAHQKLFGFFFFLSGLSFSLPRVPAAISHLPCLGMTNLSIIHFVLMIFYCLHLFQSHIFLCVFCNRLIAPSGDKTSSSTTLSLMRASWLKIKKTNLTSPGRAIYWVEGFGPWSCNGKGCGVPISPLPTFTPLLPPSPLT